MDSGNTSGSMQSSSGGEEEYDSRAESSSLSVFLNNQLPPSQVAPFGTGTTTNLQNLHPLITPPHHQNTHMFDPLSNLLDPVTQRSTSLSNTNSELNLDVMWSKPGRSEPNLTDLGGMIIPCSSSSPSSQNHAFLSRQTRGSNTNAFSTTHQILPHESGSRGLMLSVSAANNDQTHNNSNVVRNPKKRSRASRRAPTTVLTTDTTNFRAMVQEFTGIPAPPFTSSPFPRTRLDLFASAASSTLRSNSNPLDPSTTPPYLLRPFAQKLRNLHPFPHSFSTVDNLLLPSNNSTNSTTNSTSINYQQLLNFNMQNPVLGFQNTALQASPKYPLGHSSLLASKTQPSLEIPQNLKMGVFEELGLRHDHVNTDLNCLHQTMVSSTSVGVGALSSGNNNHLSNDSSTEWAQRTGTITNNDCDHGGEGGILSGTVSYSDIAERVTNGKVHYSASSSSGFHGEKGPEFTVPARSQGMVESWINCSSD
ncbi:uncharacterized protein LOC113872680 [Abrus precatorius]|uniref:Uncharacterized protein LOC113872680 n=1 Tax=Abrus precatorius TaxID=3816 RepID=A0A8B8MED1_ABRPR|nr:uncharacterized protein LOC113872680 [Abrus precatorius]